MTNQEVLDIFVSCATLACEYCNMSFRGCEDKPRFNEMRDMVISALEKQIPKKTTPIQCEELEYMCECGYKYTYSFKPNYCCYCGQKLNWD